MSRAPVRPTSLSSVSSDEETPLETNGVNSRLHPKKPVVNVSRLEAMSPSDAAALNNSEAEDDLQVQPWEDGTIETNVLEDEARLEVSEIVSNLDKFVMGKHTVFRTYCKPLNFLRRHMLKRCADCHVEDVVSISLPVTGSGFQIYVSFAAW